MEKYCRSLKNSEKKGMIILQRIRSINVKKFQVYAFEKAYNLRLAPSKMQPSSVVAVNTVSRRRSDKLFEF